MHNMCILLQLLLNIVSWLGCVLVNMLWVSVWNPTVISQVLPQDICKAHWANIAPNLLHNRSHSPKSLIAWEYLSLQWFQLGLGSIQAPADVPRTVAERMSRVCCQVPMANHNLTGIGLYVNTQVASVACSYFWVQHTILLVVCLPLWHRGRQKGLAPKDGSKLKLIKLNWIQYFIDYGLNLPCIAITVVTWNIFNLSFLSCCGGVLLKYFYSRLNQNITVWWDHRPD